MKDEHRVLFVVGVAIWHVFMTLFCMAYPLLTLINAWCRKNRDALDAAFIAGGIAIVMHWLVLKNECIISYIEKRLLDNDYRLGECPMVFPFRYVMPAWAFRAMGAIVFVSYAVVAARMCVPLLLKAMALPFIAGLWHLRRETGKRSRCQRCRDLISKVKKNMPPSVLRAVAPYLPFDVARIEALQATVAAWLSSRSLALPPAIAAIKARYEERHGLVGRPQLKLLVDALAFLAASAPELVRHGLRFLTELVPHHAQVDDGLPNIREDVLGPHKRQVVRNKLSFQDAAREAGVAHVAVAVQVGHQGAHLGHVRGAKLRVHPVPHDAPVGGIADRPVKNARLDVRRQRARRPLRRRRVAA
jgi:hypothetical protein